MKIQIVTAITAAVLLAACSAQNGAKVEAMPGPTVLQDKISTPGP